ncbi:MAG TPA: transferrin receptor-like dimerization domain-containing protein, partial [Bacteroidota bacterium]|nr:transferrin receptor-like dimerization domain-containing protein [Bacteroidota bacterium]
TSEQLPSYNAYSIDGDVTAEVVYVNYGVPKDYEELEQRGVDVKGKIVIARYGGSWRGIKPKVAAEHGAVGCIIYSDPREDGYYQGDVYPEGAYRNENGVQRGSVLDMPLYTGDPLTPGIAATKDAKRLDIKDCPVLTKIPVLPISYGDALPILQSLSGPVAPEAWRGALPITYHIGPGKSTVHLKLEFNWDIVPINDVIAKIRGSEYPDEWVMRGNHEDAWVNGAQDPLSGQVATMDEGKAIGELVKGGWKPKRTIVYMAWDAEEQGLFGSTEWAEAHADELKQKAVVYINSDSNGRGFLGAAGSHTLERFVNDVARDVMDPERSISVQQRALASRRSDRTGEDREGGKEIRLGALGSGSDYTPFLQFLGIAALNIGYGGEDGGGSYHSVYDSYDHFTRFIDPSFEYGVTLSETGGRMVIRLASAEVLPFEFTRFSETVSRYVKEVTKLADDMRAETEEMNKKIADRSLENAADPTKTYVVPKPKEPVPYLNFAPLQNAVSNLEKAAKRYEKASGEKLSTLPREKRAALNAILISMEHMLTRPEGLPGRAWYKHQVYAPGLYTGYGVKTLPAVREAIELRKWKEADEEIGVVGQTLDQYAERLQKGVGLLEGKE